MTTYGITHMQVFGLLSLSPAFGPMTFDAISGKLYDEHANSHSHDCVGAVCYSTYFFLSWCLTLATIAVLVIAWWLQSRRMSAEDGALSPSSALLAKNPKYVDYDAAFKKSYHTQL